MSKKWTCHALNHLPAKEFIQAVGVIIDDPNRYVRLAGKYKPMKREVLPVTQKPSRPAQKRTRPAPEIPRKKLVLTGMMVVPPNSQTRIHRAQIFIDGEPCYLTPACHDILRKLAIERKAQPASAGWVQKDDFDSVNGHRYVYNLRKELKTQGLVENRQKGQGYRIALHPDDIVIM